MVVDVCGRGNTKGGGDSEQPNVQWQEVSWQPQRAWVANAIPQKSRVHGQQVGNKRLLPAAPVH